MPLIRFLQNFAATTTIWADVSPSTPQLNDVIYNPTIDLWIVVGNTKRIMTSPNGTAWTTRTAGSGLESSLGHIAIGEGDAMISNRGTNVVDYSTDGITWTRKDLGQVDAPDQANGIAYSPTLDLWLAIGGSNKELSYTSDASTTPWSNIGAFTGTISASEIMWDSANSLFVAAATSNQVINTSPDGFTWTQPTSLPAFTSSAQGRAIAWDGVSTYMLAIAETVPTVIKLWRNSSGDPTVGANWSSVSHPFGTNRISSIAYGAGMWKACSEGGLIASSTDGGVTWALDPAVPSAVNLFGINYSSELAQWVAVGQAPGAFGLIFVGT